MDPTQDWRRLERRLSLDRTAQHECSKNPERATSGSCPPCGAVKTLVHSAKHPPLILSSVCALRRTLPRTTHRPARDRVAPGARATGAPCPRREIAKHVQGQESDTMPPDV